VLVFPLVNFSNNTLASRMKIAILYICTGKYKQFFIGFYNSCERFLLADYQKEYFVWTDDDTLGLALDNVFVIHREPHGFPNDSLFRFEMFLQAKDKLINYEYIYFFNSNALFLKPVGKEILPDNTGLAMGIWGGPYFTKPVRFYPYEKRKKSLAYVAPHGNNYVYYMGGLNGGRANEYLQITTDALIF